MTSSLFQGLAWLLLLATAAPALAQQANKPEPTDPKAAVAPQTHQSSLQRYQPRPEVEPSDWRGANRRVHEAGGWRAYAREAAASAPAHQH